jgi:hypothetical protein
MKDSFEIFASGFILGMALVLAIAKYADLEKQGMVQVSSGKWKCELLQRPDKTTYWDCFEVKSD